MKFSKQATVTHPPDAVLQLMIHDFEKLVPYRSRLHAQTKEKQEELPDGRIKILRKFQAMVHTVPTMLRPFMSQGMLSWHEEALWQPRDYLAKWTLRNSLSRIYNCEGTNYFEPDPGRPEQTRIRITGELTIYPDKVPGIPTFMARRLVPKAESLIVGLIEPDLAEVVTGLQAYLDDQRAKA